MPRVYPPTKTPAEEKMELYNLSQRTLDNDAFYMLTGKVREPKSRWQAIKDFFNQNIC